MTIQIMNSIIYLIINDAKNIIYQLMKIKVLLNAKRDNLNNNDDNFDRNQIAWEPSNWYFKCNRIQSR